MDNLLSRMVQAIAQYLRKPWYEQAPADDAVATSNVLIAQLFGGMLGVQRGREVRVNGKFTLLKMTTVGSDDKTRKLEAIQQPGSG